MTRQAVLHNGEEEKKKKRKKRKKDRHGDLGIAELSPLVFLFYSYFILFFFSP